ncbi:MAG: CapA family protein [Bacteroidota bacterium]
MLFTSCQSVGQEQAEVEPVPVDTTTTFTLIFSGDIMGHSPQIKAAFDEDKKAYDYEPVFEYVKPLLESADLAFGNLELTLPGKPPYSGYPQFRSPDNLAYALRESGFDVMVTANNHSNDAGKNALIHTIDTLQNLGFYQTGTFRDQADRDAFYPMILFSGDLKIALLNYTYGTNGLPDNAPTIVNRIDTIQMRKDLKMARELKPELIIVITHWGLEYKLIESPEQREVANKLFEYGADLIVGMHPHVIQPTKLQVLDSNIARLDTGLVAYSLGNFISNQRKYNTDGGIMLEIDIERHNETGAVDMTGFRHVLHWRYIERKGENITYRVLPISAAEKDTTNRLEMPTESRKAMNDFAKRMRKHLADYKVPEKDIPLEVLFPVAPAPSDTKSLPGSTGMIYRVQWQALSNKQNLSPPIDTPMVIQKEGGLFKYFLGETNNLAEAEKTLAEVREAGYPGAFIAKFKNGIRQ